jgi:hypothetical protein
LVEHTTENRGVGGSIPPLTTTAPTLVLLCAPSMGVLDNWLPVLDAARADHPDGRIVALIPDRDTLAQLDPDDTAHVMADELIDATVAPLVGGGWVEAPGLLAARDLARPRRIIPRLATRAQRQHRTDPVHLAGPSSRLLYDVHLHGKARIRPLLDSFAATPRFSHNHGVELEEIDERRTAPPDPEHVAAAFLYGPSEVDAYATNFALDRAVLHPVGIARHEPAWVRTVVARSEQLHTLPFATFAFVVSRPAGSPYLPHDRKVAALRALHQVLWVEHGLPLVLRTHPKEGSDGTLDEALPADDEGISWARSRAHPFHLATRSRLAVTFLSGVAVDLVALGVPVIELLDVRGIPAYDGPDSTRDARGRPSFGPYRRDGLVIPADDRDDLRAMVANLMSDSDRALAPLQQQARNHFSDPTGATPRMLALLVAGTDREQR